MNERWRDRAVGREKNPDPEEGRERATTGGGLRRPPLCHPDPGDTGHQAGRTQSGLTGRPSGPIQLQGHRWSSPGDVSFVLAPRVHNGHPRAAAPSSARLLAAPTFNFMVLYGTTCCVPRGRRERECSGIACGR